MEAKRKALEAIVKKPAAQGRQLIEEQKAIRCHIPKNPVVMWESVSPSSITSTHYGAIQWMLIVRGIS